MAKLTKLAALAEVLLVLALGNLIGEALYGAIAPASVLAGEAGEIAQSFYAGLLILLRLGLAGAMGLLLLYYRRGVTPRQAGLGRNGHPLSRLCAQGVVMGLLASFLVAALFALHDLVPFGTGLESWWTYSDTSIDLAFWIYLLGTSVLIPPLTEEIMTRGYFRMRLVESYGVMAGVILTGLVFGLSHTRYLNGDPMLLLFMGIILVNSTTWTYLAQKTGSIIPALIAHAISNGIATAILFNIWIPFVLLSVAMVLLYKPILAGFGEFRRDWRQDRERAGLWQGLALVFAILIAALVLLNLAGRGTTLLGLGLFCLLVTVVNLVAEKRRRREVFP